MASYISAIQMSTDRTSTIDKMCEAVKDADAIAVRGCSGCIIGSMVAYACEKPLILVRKEADLDNSHCEGELITFGYFYQNRPLKTYAIVDDFVETGRTVLSIVNSINEERPDIECLGICIYEEYEYGIIPLKEIYKIANEDIQKDFPHKLLG